MRSHVGGEVPELGLGRSVTCNGLSPVAICFSQWMKTHRHRMNCSHWSPIMSNTGAPEYMQNICLDVGRLDHRQIHSHTSCSVRPVGYSKVKCGMMTRKVTRARTNGEQSRLNRPKKRRRDWPNVEVVQWLTCTWKKWGLLSKTKDVRHGKMIKTYWQSYEMIQTSHDASCDRFSLMRNLELIA